MKKNALFVLLAISALFIACNSTASKEDLLKRKWDYKRWELNGEVTEPKALEAPSMEFRDGGKYILIAGMAVKEATWELNGDTVTVIAENEKPHSMTIMELTDTSLVMESVSGEMKTIITLAPSTRESFLPEPEEHEHEEGEEHDHDHDHDDHEGHTH